MLKGRQSHGVLCEHGTWDQPEGRWAHQVGRHSQAWWALPGQAAQAWRTGMRQGIWQRPRSTILHTASLVAMA